MSRADGRAALVWFAPYVVLHTWLPERAPGEPVSLSHKNVPSAGAVTVADVARSLKKKMVLSFPLSKIQIPIELCELTSFSERPGFHKTL